MDLRGGVLSLGGPLKQEMAQPRKQASVLSLLVTPSVTPNVTPSATPIVTPSVTPAAAQHDQDEDEE